MNDQSVPTKPGFWERQFKGPRTSNQTIFDVAFGIVLPLFCFKFDPLVFTGGVGEGPLLENYQLFAYMFSGLEMVALAFWLVRGLRSSLLKAFVGGVLLAGGIFSSVLGAVLVPYSLLGLLFVIGILGFTPFVTAFVFFRNAFRSLQDGGREDYEPRPSMVLLGWLLPLSATFFLSAGLDDYMQKSVNDMIYGNEQQAWSAARHLRPLSLINKMKCEVLVTDFQLTTDPQRKEHLQNLYKEATGEEIQAQIRYVD